MMARLYVADYDETVSEFVQYGVWQPYTPFLTRFWFHGDWGLLSFSLLAGMWLFDRLVIRSAWIRCVRGFFVEFIIDLGSWLTACDTFDLVLGVVCCWFLLLLA